MATKIKQIKYKASIQEVDELSKVSKETGITKSDILRVGVRTIAKNLKSLHSDIKKKLRLPGLTVNQFLIKNYSRSQKI